jgi:hypothetical protein
MGVKFAAGWVNLQDAWRNLNADTVFRVSTRTLFAARYCIEDLIS